MPKIFISYRRSDTKFQTTAIYNSLCGSFVGDEIFMDIDGILKGRDFRKEITRAVQKCDVVLAVVGDNWLTATDARGGRLDNPADFVRLEIEAALERDIPLIPLLIDDAQMPAPDELPESLREFSYRNAGIIRSGRDFNRDLEILVEDIRNAATNQTLETLYQKGTEFLAERNWQRASECFEEVLAENGEYQDAAQLLDEAKNQRRKEEPLAVVMHTGIVDSAGLLQRLGATVTADLVAQHDKMFHAALAQAEDAEILDETGDGFLVRFEDPGDAVEAALRLQFLAAAEPFEGEPIQIHIGIHLGAMTELEDRIRSGPLRTGMALNLSARMMEIAHAGQILVTRAIFDGARQHVREHPLLEGAADLPPLVWMIHGDYRFKGSSDPVAIFEVGAAGIAPQTPPGDGLVGSKVPETGSDQIFTSLPHLPADHDTATPSGQKANSRELLKSQRDHYGQAHRELQAEIARLKKSEAARARELEREADSLGEERVRLEKLSAELAVRRQKEKRAGLEMSERAREASREAASREAASREAETRIEELNASLAAEKAAFEKEREAEAAEMQGAAQQKLRALESREREIQEREKLLAKELDPEKNAALQRERERLETEHGEFLREMEAQRNRIEDERLEFVREQEEERRRAEEEAAQQLAKREEEHAAALGGLQSTLAEQEAELELQRAELEQAEERIRQMQLAESDPARSDDSMVTQLQIESGRFSSIIDELNEDLEQTRRLQKRRLITIAAGSVVLALIVGIFSAKAIWGFWPWKIFDSTETQPNLVIEGLKQLKSDRQWPNLLDATIEAERLLQDDQETIGEVEKFASDALHELADPSPPRQWETDFNSVLDDLRELEKIATKNGWSLPAEHRFLICRILILRVLNSGVSEAIADVPDVIAAYRSYYQEDLAATSLSGELDDELNKVLEGLLEEMDDEDSLPHEAAISEALEKIPPDQEQIPNIRLVKGRLQIRVQLRSRPADLSGALSGLNELAEWDTDGKRLRRPLENILESMDEQPDGPSNLSKEELKSLLSREELWQDSRPLVTVVENFGEGSPIGEEALRKLTELHEQHWEQTGDPLPDDDLMAWVGYAYTGTEREFTEGMEMLQNLSKIGNAKAKYFLVNHELTMPDKPLDAAKLEELAKDAEDAANAGEPAAWLLLGNIYTYLSDIDKASAAKHLKKATGSFHTAIDKCRPQRDRDEAIYRLAGVYAGVETDDPAVRRDIAKICTQAARITLRGDTTEMATKLLNQAREADPETAKIEMEKEIKSANDSGNSRLATELRALRDAADTTLHPLPSIPAGPTPR